MTDSGFHLFKFKLCWSHKINPASLSINTIRVKKRIFLSYLGYAERDLQFCHVCPFRTLQKLKTIKIKETKQNNARIFRSDNVWFLGRLSAFIPSDILYVFFGIIRAYYLYIRKWNQKIGTIKRNTANVFGQGYIS